MKIRYIICISVIFCWMACKDTSSTKTRSVSPERITAIKLQRPGFFIASGDYLYLSDLESKDTVVQVFDKERGKKVGIINPDNILVHTLGTALNGNILIQDFISDNMGIYSADKVAKGEKPCVQEGKSRGYKAAICQVDSDKYIYTNQLNEKHPLSIVQLDGTLLSSFGSIPPIDSLSLVKNRKETGLSQLFYSPDSLYLLYRRIDMPFLQLYKQDGSSFQLIAEQILTVNKQNEGEVIKATLTKDYIVLLNEREEVEEKTQQSMLVSELILLDKTFTPSGIIKLPDHTYSICSDCSDNTIYVVSSENENFYIGKLQCEVKF